MNVCSVAPINFKSCGPIRRLTNPRHNPETIANSKDCLAINFAFSLLSAPIYLEIKEEVPIPKAIKTAIYTFNTALAIPTPATANNPIWEIIKESMKPTEVSKIFSTVAGSASLISFFFMFKSELDSISVEFIYITQFILLY